uniref:Uncharacterized protein n=1 Tax=Anopheles christyi TaxID=43041 RepID=A0A182K4L8_9DIPT
MAFFKSLVCLAVLGVAAAGVVPLATEYQGDYYLIIPIDSLRYHAAPAVYASHAAPAVYASHASPAVYAAPAVVSKTVVSHAAPAVYASHAAPAVYASHAYAPAHGTVEYHGKAAAPLAYYH